MNTIILTLSMILLTPHLAFATPSDDMWAGWDIEEDDDAIHLAKKNGPKKGKFNKAKREKRRAKVEKKIRTYLVLELTDALDLDASMALKLSSNIEKTQAEQHVLREKAHKAMEKLKDMVENEKSTDSDLKKQTQKAQKAMKKARKMNEALFESISDLLNPRQQAQLLLVGPEIHGKIHHMLQKARRGGKKGPGHRGPRGGGGPSGHGGPGGHGGPHY